MQLHWSIPAAGMGLCLSLLTSGAARAVSFTFTKIADTSSTFSSFLHNPSINDAGTVAFSAALNTGDTGVFTGSGGAITDIAVGEGVGRAAPSFHLIPAAPAINNAGTVAFETYTSGSSGGLGVVYTGTGSPGKPLTTIASFSSALGSYLITSINPVINDAGTVAFAALMPPPSSPFFNEPSILAGNGGPLTTVVPKTVEPDYLALNNAGTLAFAGSTNGYIGSGGLFTVSSSGGPVTTIADSGSYSGPISINQAGTIAIRAVSPAGHTDIFTFSSSGRPLTTVVSGGFSFAPGILTILDTPSINDNGTVAFSALLRGGSGEGIFIGPDPEADRVIATGDSLFGSTVSNFRLFDEQDIGFSTRGLNNRGQIAFYAQLADGTSGIFRADPIAVPESYSMLNAFWLSALGAGAMLKRCRKEVG